MFPEACFGNPVFPVFIVELLRSQGEDLCVAFGVQALFAAHWEVLGGLGPACGKRVGLAREEVDQEPA